MVVHSQVINLRCAEYCLQITAAKLDLRSLVEKKKQYEQTDNGHRRSCTQNYRPGEDV